MEFMLQGDLEIFLMYERFALAEQAGSKSPAT
jgi:hypothetical protein